VNTDDVAPTTPALALDAETGDRLRTRVLPVDHPPTLWPVAAPTLPATFLSVRAEVSRQLWAGPGWAVVDTGLAGGTADEVASGAWNLFTALCEPVPQYRSGELVHSVEVAPHAADVASAYSQSNRSGTFHTDGTLLDTVPDLAMLAGIEAADEGGATVVIDGRAVVARLAEDTPADLAVLEQSQPVHSGDPGEPLVRHAVVDRSGEDVVFRYNPHYIRLGYAREGRAVPDEVSRATTTLDALAADPGHQVPVLIARGHVLLWNNLRCLHGRRAFTERTHRRRLLRAYGRRVAMP
jgi:alpha-ketoglutarate-dependent taurine dioxygenase